MSFLSRRPPGKKLDDIVDDMLVFGPDKRKAVTISLNQADWGCILQDGRELDGSLMDFLLRHIVYRADPEVRQHYALTHNWMSNCM